MFDIKLELSEGKALGVVTALSVTGGKPESILQDTKGVTFSK